MPGYEQLACSLGFGEDELLEGFDDQRWRYRVNRRDVRALRSGMESRLYSAVRLSFPLRRSQIAVMQVFVICIYLEYSSIVLLALLRKHGHKFPVVYNTIFEIARASVVKGGPMGAILLIEAEQALKHD